MSGELPNGWALSTLDAIGPIISGGTPKTKEPENFDGEIPWVTPADLTGFTSKMISRGRRNISKRGLETSSARILPARSVLFSSRAPIGYVAVAANELSTNQGFKSVAVSPEMDESYVYHYLKSAKHLAEQQASGTTFKEISGSRFAKLPFPVAPVNEQHRIVEKIETLFARLDKGEEAVREVQKLLKRYRQSILKSAVTGELTADWRAEREGELESGTDLLARILKSREENWQGRGKYKAPVSPDTSDLTNLPTGWTWTSVDALISDGPKNGIYLPKSKYGSGTPIIRIDDFQTGWVRQRAELRCVAAEKAEQSEYSLRENDLVINRVNSVSHLGKVLLVRDEHDGCLFESNMMRLKITEECNPNYVAMYLASEIGRKRLISNCKHAVNQASINQGDVKATPIPLPPVAEQIEIFSAVNAYLESAKAVERACEIELKRSTALRQSILKDAFSGRLVPQDPNDEPASALLERIQQSKKKRK